MIRKLARNKFVQCFSRPVTLKATDNRVVLYGAAAHVLNLNLVLVLRGAAAPVLNLNLVLVLATPSPGPGRRR